MDGIIIIIKGILIWLVVLSAAAPAPTHYVSAQGGGTSGTDLARQIYESAQGLSSGSREQLINVQYEGPAGAVVIVKGPLLFFNDTGQLTTGSTGTEFNKYLWDFVDNMIAYRGYTIENIIFRASGDPAIQEATGPSTSYGEYEIILVKAVGAGGG